MVEMVGGMLRTHPRVAVIVAMFGLGMVGMLAIGASIFMGAFQPKNG